MIVDEVVIAVAVVFVVAAAYPGHFRMTYVA